jgi:BCD family chlorophyll transporter-like MFS transporter
MVLFHRFTKILIQIPFLSVTINLMSSSSQAKLPLWRILKLGLFHIGSAMIDLLAFSVWNRVMIVELGLPATPVGLVLTLHNFLAPLLVWGGYLSDVRPLAGLRRLPYALGGRLLMVAPFPLLPLIAWSIASGASWGWSVAFIAFVLYGIGRAISGTAFLALIHDVAPAEQRGRAVGIVWTMLITGFAVVPILYARLLPVYDPAAVQKLFLVAPTIATALFFISLWGEEKRQPAAAATRQPAPAPLRRTLAAVWNNTGTRVFAAFLLISALFIFAYDQILEPFGGDVFSLPENMKARLPASAAHQATLPAASAASGRASSLRSRKNMPAPAQKKWPMLSSSRWR